MHSYLNTQCCKIRLQNLKKLSKLCQGASIKNCKSYTLESSDFLLEIPGIEHNWTKLLLSIFGIGAKLSKFLKSKKSKVETTEDLLNSLEKFLGSYDENAADKLMANLGVNFESTHPKLQASKNMTEEKVRKTVASAKSNVALMRDEFLPVFENLIEQTAKKETVSINTFLTFMELYRLKDKFESKKCEETGTNR